MRYYETLYIVNPNLENEALDTTMAEIGTELEKSKSKIINHRMWSKKRLAYHIDKQKYGSYILLQFEGGDQEEMNEFNTWMKLNNTVLRHMTIVLEEKPDVYKEEVKEEPKSDPANESKDASDAKTEDVESSDEKSSEKPEKESTESKSEGQSPESDNVDEKSNEDNKETEEKEAE
ncbi:MAG: 30S ribosomal protein S6 [Candidatus Marinimicrobia bacterium]|jgi:small subunit ribosomal protein S6|nr:30S ribosomal protein S6 [Candidatus Neomarinimicrobiota bacterium]MBT3838414.1 30S ribosomal protein S6 [Candidatus Neomarinimicrobiota bacterium]MBT3998719.1 30S ribosomal protein S6 [Candidatus Neomarinimicrobiota bacterium]MBT4283298.1 30S ribosomal protein S6 [Candidatus Neomarinimicrobiota bacterium]MBT4578389.1 30S ribosomal protein S6 [Candidatus Neomarinimicrobiota bacterium]